MILAVGTILGACFVVASIFTGVGLLARHVLVSDVRLDAEDKLEAFWVGYAAALLFLQLWHFVFPVSALAAVPLALAGGAGLWVTRSQLRAAPSQFSDRRWLRLTVFVPIALWVAILATSPILLNDTGLYHRPIVEWYKAYPIVPGLVNLHTRFGYNSSHLLYAALADSFLPGRAEHVVNSPLVLALLAQLGLAGWRLATRERGGAYCFDIVLLTPTVFVLLSRDLASFSTDFAMAIALFAVTPRIYRFLSSPPPAEDLNRFRVAAFTLILCTTVAVKLTAAALVVPILLVLLGIGYRRARVGREPALRGLLAIPIGICVVIAGVWATRSVVLSGYPAYPFRFGALPVSWRQPESILARHALVADLRNRFFFDWRSNEELLEEVRTGRWFRQWLRHLPSLRARDVEAFWRISLPLILVVVAMVIGLGRFVRSRAPPPNASALLLLASGAALVAWFSRFPEPRYGMPIAWVLAGVAIAELSRLLALRRTGGRAVVMILLGMASVQAFWPATLAARARQTSFRSALVSRLASWPWPGELRRVRSVPLREFETVSGLRLYTPITLKACWLAPLTCTPEPHSDLRLRVPGELRSGFEGGEWRAPADP